MQKRNTILSRAWAITLLIALSWVIPAWSETIPTDVLSSIKIDNFGKIDDNYFRGAQPEMNDYSDLAALGVKTVINLTSDDADRKEPTMVESAGMKYVHIPMTTHEPPTVAELTKFLSVVNDPAYQPVYVHCVGGKHRTGVMTAVYRMIAHGWNGKQAFKEMKSYKYGPDFLHSEFKKFVYDFNPAIVVAGTSSGPVATASSSN